MIKLNDQELARREKLNYYKEKNVEAFPKSYGFENRIYSTELKAKFANLTKEEIEAKKPVNVNISGRIMTKRGSFLVLQDTKGQIQAYYPKKELEAYNHIFDKLDIGDIIYVSGIVMKTHTGEVTVRVNALKLVTKSLKPLPEKFHGLVDPEEKLRKRYLDTIMNEETRNRFIIRSKVISLIREYFDKNDYLEVETPLLHDYLGGASAKPFKTHHNALNQDYYLRVATELPLKKLLVGGFDRVYEMGKVFRNEGIDTTHNPEFTSIEYYEAYSNMYGMMEHTEKVIKHICKYLGIKLFKFGDVEFPLTKPFNRIDMVDAVSKSTGVDFRKASFDKAKEAAKKYKIKVEKYFTTGHIINALFEELIEHTLIEPTFVMGHPIEISPLSAKAKDGRFTERAELFINKKSMQICIPSLMIQLTNLLVLKNK
ncbi:lysyl-tRNA synthetase [Mycoplasmopsis californica]|nr:lysyl-tRNA synthetase [Mycoplasmopsis californica]